MRLKGIWLLLAFPVLITGCQPSKKLTKTDLSDMYSEKAFTEIRPKVYHENDSLSTLYLSINTGDFIPVVSRATSDTVIRFKVSWELYNSYESMAVCDSSTSVYNDVKKISGTSEMILSFKIRTLPAANYILKISLTDLDRQEGGTIIKYCEMNRTDPLSRQYFLVTDINDLPLFNDYIGNNTEVIIRYSVPGCKRLLVRYYNRKHPVAQPPFALEKDQLFRFEADSLFSMVLDPLGKSDVISLLKPGIYHFQPDTSYKAGLTLMRFYDGYPEISDPRQALYSLRYLTTRQEYDNMLKYADPKTAIDSFWLYRSSQDPVRAKGMILKYYSRVEFSNRFFSTHKEGWKTDRGIVYIIYGAPTHVYFRGNEEDWLYGEPRNPLSITFTFYRIDNPFTSNDFRMERSASYKQSWYMAVENWRRK